MNVILTDGRGFPNCDIILESKCSLLEAGTCVGLGTNYGPSRNKDFPLWKVLEY